MFKIFRRRPLIFSSISLSGSTAGFPWTACWQIAGTCIVLSLFVPNIAGAARLTLEDKQQSSGMNKFQKYEVDIPRISKCFKPEKYSGELVPCDYKVRSGGVIAQPPADEPPPTVSKAFNYFDSNQSEEDYLENPQRAIPVAYLLSQLSAIAYREPGFAETPGSEQAYGLAEKLGLEHLSVIEAAEASFLDFGGPGGNTTVYVFYNDTAVIVAFRGSQGWIDWEDSDLDAWPYYKPEWGAVNHQVCAPYSACVSWQTDVVTLHNGFYDAADIVYRDLVSAIAPLLLDGRRLWITGHSLGGAVATITAFRLQFDENIDVQGVHVFGAPAVGDANWEQAFNETMSNVHRWGLEGDPAPLFTQAPMFFHVGFINNLYANGTVLLNASPSQMLGYSSPCSLLDGLNIIHMNYWPRMAEALANYSSVLAENFGESLPGAGDCHS